MPRVRRSVLFSPGDRPAMMRKASTTGADVLVFDLEDAVAPERKGEAREAVREALAGVDSRPAGAESDADSKPAPGPEVLVRVTHDAWEADLDRVLGGDSEPDGIVLPKVAAAAEVEALAAGIAERSEGHGELPIVALIESARGVLNAAAIADVPATDALCFGAEDLAADVGAERTPEGTEVFCARQQVALAAGAAKIDAIDTVLTAIDERDRLGEEARFARRLGYDGKMAIHPAQVSVINAAFTPDPDRIEWAERVLDAREDANAEEKGVFRVDNEMIDAPLIAQAERIVALARAANGDRGGEGGSHGR